MRFRITDEEKWLRRLAGMPLQEQGLREGPQCLICRSWNKDKVCGHCRNSQNVPQAVGKSNGSARLDLDGLIRRMQRDL